jgi:hypothetical protein
MYKLWNLTMFATGRGVLFRDTEGRQEDFLRINVM